MTHPTDLLPLPEQLWLMYAKKKPSLRRVSITNDLSAEEKSSGWVAEPYARANIAAMAGEPSPAAVPAGEVSDAIPQTVEQEIFNDWLDAACLHVNKVGDICGDPSDDDVRQLMRVVWDRCRASASSAAVGGPDTLRVKVKQKLFSFHCEQDWVNKAQRRYANCGVQKGYYITVDAEGHVMHRGQCFKHATYPVTCFELQTNWHLATPPSAQQEGD